MRFARTADLPRHRIHPLEKALIVSTNEYMYLLVVVLLQLAVRCKARLALTRASAIDALALERFKYVICDFDNDPELSTATIEHVRAHRPALPVIVIFNPSKQPYPHELKTDNCVIIERLNLQHLTEVLHRFEGRASHDGAL